MRAGIFGLVVTLAGCAGEPVAPPPPPCDGDRFVIDGACVTSGVPPLGCASGFVHDGSGGCEPILPATPCAQGTLLTLGATTCLPIGVATCGDAATSDGRGGCLPTLPTARCAAGTMASPGEASCRDIVACGSGTWGDIVRDAGTIYVSATAATGGDGSEAKPFRTVREALDAAPVATTLPTIAIAAGTYKEALVVDKTVRLVGRCPSMVTIEPPTLDFALDLTVDAEVRGLSTKGGAGGVRAAGNVTHLSALHVHDTAAEGIFAVSGSLTLRDVVVERARDVGVEILDAAVTLDRVVVLDTAASLTKLFGRGISIEGRFPVAMRHVLVEGSKEIGVFALLAPVTIEDSVVRDTAARVSDRRLGHGIELDAKASLVMRRSLILGSRGIGLALFGADATVEDSVVRGVPPSAGKGIAADVHEKSGRGSSLTILRSVVEKVVDGGIAIVGSKARIERTLVRDISARADGRFGGCVVAESQAGVPSELTMGESALGPCVSFGIVVKAAPAALARVWVHDIASEPVSRILGMGIDIEERTTAENVDSTVSASIVERTHEAGIAVRAARVVVDGTLVRDILPRGRTLEARAIDVLGDPFEGVRAELRLTGSVLARASEIGVFVMGGTATIERSVIRDTKPLGSTSTLGDGIGVTRYNTLLPGLVVLRDSLLAGHARAGVFVSGADVSVEGTRIWCTGIPLDVETLVTATEPFSPTLNDRGRNVCGCGSTWTACAAQSTGLAPLVPR